MGNKINTFGMDIIDIYKLVIEGKLKRFPKYTWEKPESYEDANKCTRYLIENILCWEGKDICDKCRFDTFRSNYLYGMLCSVYQNSPFNAIDAAYPGRFKPWEFISVPNNFWTPETAIESTKWLIEERLKWKDTDIKEKLSTYTFLENKILTPLIHFYNSSPYAAIDAAYPGRFKPWELSIAPNKFWTRENAIIATKWLIEEKLKLSTDDIKERVGVRFFIDNNLGGMLQTVYNGSPYAAIKAAYPDRF